MNGISYRQFALPEVLKEVGKDLLLHFCAHFQSDLAAKNITLPEPDLPDDEYFKSLAALLRCPALLPESFKETLFDIEDLASPERSPFLKENVAELGQGRIIVEGVCHERAALQLWLIAPAVLLAVKTRQNNLTSFRGFGSEVRITAPPAVRPPEQGNIDAISANLNSWFRERNPNAPTARVELHFHRPGEFWFLVRHGDTCRWIHDDEEGTAQLIHSAPEDEEAILYLTDEHELWVAAKTEQDREFYRQEFGRQLQGEADFFSQACELTLEPLRTEGCDSLDARASQPIRQMAVGQLEVDRGGGAHETTTKTVEDAFQASKAAKGYFISNNEKLIRAGFLIQLAGSDKARAFEICPPNSLDIERPSDLPAVVRLLSKRGFRLSEPEIHHRLSKAA